MKTKAIRFYGACDLRLEEVELPEIQEDEILAEVVSDTMCASTYKAVQQGKEYYRAPDDIAVKPVMIGHELCGIIRKVGKKWRETYKEGEKFVIQPAIPGEIAAAGFSYPYFGGCTQYTIIPEVAVRKGAIMPYHSDEAYLGSLTEPMSCVIHTFHAMYHLGADYTEHIMGIREGGNCAIFAGAGPMGMAAIDYAIHCDRKPGTLLVTDIDERRLERVASIYSVEEAKKNGVRLCYLNTSEKDAEEQVMALTEGKGYDDILVMAPVKPVIEMADRVLAEDGCLNFFSGPSDKSLKAEINFYDVHYMKHHYIGTTGGRTEDIRETVDLLEESRLNPSGLVTHVGGLDTVIDSIMNFPRIPGGKKLIYPHIKFPLTAITEFREKGMKDPMFRELADICDRHNGLWCGEAEKYLLAHAEKISNEE
jgi:threonine dehydrogenase-like Zn-dependent dehydrogenase|nr:zinc-binding dehydrogenase [uncultured Schaedlerella sp.]